MKYSRKAKVVGKLRKTQLITTFGPGAIADMPEYSVIMAGTNFWKNRSEDRLYEPNLQKLLGVNYFVKPHTSDTDAVQGNPDVPAFRFPMMHFCPKCGRLMEYRYFGDKEGKKCTNCKRRLVPSRFLCACKKGHLEDFPYDWWVHNGNPYDCTEPERHDKLSIEFSSKSGGLESIIIKCNSCGKTRSMAGCMSNGALKGYRCKGIRPWLGLKKEFRDPVPCSEELHTVQRGASNVYFSITQSALTIPPWSKKIQNLLEDHWETLSDAYANNMDESNIRILVKSFYKDEIESGEFTIDDFMNEINRRLNMMDVQTEYSIQDMFEDEYRALIQAYNGENEDQFKTEDQDIPEELEDYIISLVKVKRLREVLALKGFRRISPLSEDTDGTGSNTSYTPLADVPKDWLPGIELLGEGIFVAFNNEKIYEWQQLIGTRYQNMEERLNGNDVSSGKFSPRYVLLHTLSHLLIRQLTIQCGYSGAALKERIYSTYKDSDVEMAGILIYTASSDSDGSLGGLVRQATPELFKDILLNALQDASWCSSDPICIESMYQGFNSLNYAACHACTLLPETSCEARNCLLDRVAVVGKPGHRSMGFFGDILEE